MAPNYCTENMHISLCFNTDFLNKSNIYWFIKMIDNSAYFWLTISAVAIKIVALAISSLFEELNFSSLQLKSKL